MTNRKRTYDQAFKVEAVRLSETSDKSVSQIEIDLDITPGLLHKWRARSRQHGEQSFPGKGQQTETEAELRRLKRENEVLRQEREILKKALQVFSRDGQ